MKRNAEHEQALDTVPILAGLSKRQRSRLLDASRVVAHAPGHEVAAEGKGALALHVVLDGSATVTIRGQQRRTLGSGDYFGEISLIDGRPRSATVTADGPLSTLVVPHHEFQSMLLEDPTCALGLLTVICSRLREAEAAH